MFTWLHSQPPHPSRSHSASALFSVVAALAIPGGCASGRQESAGVSGATTSATIETDGSTTSSTEADPTGGTTSTNPTSGATSGTTSGTTPGTTADSDTTGAGTTDESGGDAAVCGDGVPEDDEQCDDGNANDLDNCSNSCQLPVCGDGVRAGVEECDDGNANDGDVCTNACTLAVCGDGVIGPGEVCDDIGASALCDADCTEVACGDGAFNAAAGEACDDGNADAGDACSPVCESTKIASLAVGQGHVCVAFDSGVARCWGDGTLGGLGYGDTEKRGDAPGELPTPNLELGGKVLTISGGWYHRCALLEGGSVRCWGDNEFGQLGYGDTEDRGDGPGEMPPPTVSLGGPASAIGVGSHHACAIVADTVRCWGRGIYGGLGYGDTANRGDKPGDMPPPPVPGLSGIVQLAVGQDHNCVLLDNGEVRCWGRGFHGVLGQGSTANVGDGPGEMPPPPVAVGGKVTQISGGNSHTCVLLDNGVVRCWGNSEYGQLGYGDKASRGDAPGELPTPAVPLGDQPVATLFAGYVHTCALLTSGKVKCWGLGASGGLGLGDTKTLGDDPGEMPPPDAQLGGDVVALSARNAQFTCALLADDRLRCWGYNPSGELGLGHTMNIGDDELPLAVAPVPY